MYLRDDYAVVASDVMGGSKKKGGENLLISCSILINGTPIVRGSDATLLLCGAGVRILRGNAVNSRPVP